MQKKQGGVTLIMLDQKINTLADTVHDVLVAVNAGFTHVEERFRDVDTRLNRLETDISTLKTDMVVVKSDMIHVKSEMITKDYLDRKLSDLKGGMVSALRKEDTKVVTLVNTLEQNKTLTKSEAKKITSMEPFAQ